MKRQMKCWKVIRRNRMSAIERSSRKLQLRYPVGVTVKPKLEGSRLMVFERKTQADRFVRGCEPDKLMVVPCITYGVIHTSFVSGGTYKYIKRFWQRFNNNESLRFEPTYTPVEGTLFAKSVRCLE